MGIQDFALVVYNAYDTVEPPLGRPTNFTATATSPTQVQLSWTAASSALTYDVERSSGVDDPYSTIALSLTGVTFLDTGRDPNRTYLYRVRAKNSTNVESLSDVDPATTVMFSDDPLVVGVTPISANHLTQMHVAADAMRAAAGFPTPTSWTDGTITPSGTLIRALHVTELRSAVSAAREGLGLSTPPFTDSTLTAGVTVVKAIHLHELREGVK